MSDYKDYSIEELEKMVDALRLLGRTMGDENNDLIYKIQNELDRKLAMSPAGELTHAYNDGISDAFKMANNWADQCGGGSGKDGEGYRNLATSILRLLK